MISIEDLKAGDEVIIYMLNGLALEIVRKYDGTAYRSVPKKTKKASPTALTRCRGTLISNNTDIKTLMED